MADILRQNENDLRTEFLRNLYLSQHREDGDGYKLKSHLNVATPLNAGIYPRVPRDRSKDFKPYGQELQEDIPIYETDEDLSSYTSYNQEDDYDDSYSSSSSYYNREDEDRERREEEYRKEEENELNSNCLELALEYNEYLNNGGEPIEFK